LTTHTYPVYSAIVTSGIFLNIDRENMYKQILLTDKELELLASIIRYYIGEKLDNPGFEYHNAHILLRHLIGKKPSENNNQISFYGK
jgi:hypothetical protein